MKFIRADFRKLQSSILAAALMTAAGGTALYVSYDAREAAERARLVVTAQLEEADGKLRRVRQEESEVKEKSIVFTRLQERGIEFEQVVSLLERLDWVELLKEIRDKHRLIDLQYEISPQRLLDGNPGDDFAFFASAMKVQLKLLHEEDLTRLLDDLRRQGKALIRVKGCRVERLPANGDDRASGRAQLSAECEIDWLTLRDVRRK